WNAFRLIRQLWVAPMKNRRDSGLGIRDSIRCVFAVAILVTCARSAAAQTNYQVGAQDVLTITVFGEADLSGKYTVEQDGTFTFPLIGRVKPGGMTLRGFEQELKKQLADGYLRNPQVTVSVETYRSQRIIVMGEVRSGGG